MSMDRTGTWLFGVSAVFNAVAGVLLFLRPPLVQAALGIPHLEGIGIVFADFCALLIVLFGAAYACVAFDEVRFRPYIPLGAAGKLMAVSLVWSAWMRGSIGAVPSVLVSADLVFVMLFIAYLRATPARACV